MPPLTVSQRVEMEDKASSRNIYFRGGGGGGGSLTGEVAGNSFTKERES